MFPESTRVVQWRACRPRHGPATTGQVFSLIRDGRARHPQRGRAGHRPLAHRGRRPGRRAARVRAGRRGRRRRSAHPPPADARRCGSGSTATRASCSPARSGAAAPSSASATSTATCSPTSDLDQEVGSAAEELMPKVVAGFADLLDGLGRPADAVRAVGLSIPGTVDYERGASLDSPIMSGWDGVELAPFLRELTDGAGLRRQRRQRDGALRAARPPRAAPRPASS